MEGKNKQAQDKHQESSWLTKFALEGQGKKFAAPNFVAGICAVLIKMGYACMNVAHVTGATWAAWMTRTTRVT